MTNEILKENFLTSTTNFVKQNSKLLILLLVTILIFLFTYLFYKNLQDKSNIQIAEKYTTASILIKQNKIEESKILLEAIIKKKHQFYSPLSLYLIIDNDIENDNKKIISFFDQILKNNSISNENLNLIKIKKAIYLINIDDEKLIIETLNPVINSNSVWREIAINLIKEYFLSKDQKIKAEEYNQLLQNRTKK